jgi:hypothetical protein
LAPTGDIRGPAALSLADDGASLRAGAFDAAALARLSRALAGQPADRAGVRLFGLEAIKPVLDAKGQLGRLAAAEMSGQPRPVRAILFDKTAETNWSLGWHQDRVIAVRRRIDVAGFGPWSRKHGVLHVAPPFDVLARMLTLRLHLDATSADNAPLLIAPGSHRLGRIPEREILAIVERCGVAACLADAGDVWLYATPILHASETAFRPARRRVLQVDYAIDDLPGGLEWAGV